MTEPNNTPIDSPLLDSLQDVIQFLEDIGYTKRPFNYEDILLAAEYLREIQDRLDTAQKALDGIATN